MDINEIYPTPEKPLITWKQAIIFIIVLAIVLFCVDRIIGVIVSG